MEQHGKNPQQNVIAIIPARYESVRLPGKLLLEIAGKPLIFHTLERARNARTVNRVIVATDDARIRDAVCSAGGEAVMTSPDHQSGSDRIAEVAQNLPEGTIIVNVQGDEPLISPETIDRAVIAISDECGSPRVSKGDIGNVSISPLLTRGLGHREAVILPDIVTTCEPIESLEELLNGNVVKVVLSDSGRAIYFSRSPMPFPRDAALRHGGDPNQAIAGEPELLSNFRKHTGLYIYRREYLLKFTKLPRTHLEKFEMLEQLRALENGAYIKVVEAATSSIGVDTREDFDKVRQILESERGQAALPDLRDC